ncbi:hypothetical protein [Anaeromicrobium sediminis]|uniref:hypothetical protein n=1 Tax=Anaeromicrobium sediminis TaxID=1478221 RepID=UPI001594F375|nr:hypothetical protein [Anaeromicrobium sediminis]
MDIKNIIVQIIEEYDSKGHITNKDNLTTEEKEMILRDIQKHIDKYNQRENN